MGEMMVRPFPVVRISSRWETVEDVGRWVFIEGSETNAQLDSKNAVVRESSGLDSDQNMSLRLGEWI